MHGIYIHIPFCIQKCNYCDFASYPQMITKQDEYINALISEMKSRRGLKANTVYIGGGTPSVLSAYNIRTLLCAVNEIFNLDAETEFTIEINPGTLDADKAAAFKEYGVNRISIGSQSFIDNELKTLGRIHTAAETVNTYNMLRQMGFDNISLDLMYALPGQTIDSLQESLDTLLSLSPEHISCYGLKIEEATAFYKMLCDNVITEATDDTFAQMYEIICSRLKQAGYIHYEISNFAKEGRESRHNLKYWNKEDYVGFGVAASSCEGLRRYTHSAVYSDYMQGYKLSEDYIMTKEESMSEFVILGLRVLNSGVNKSKFKDKYHEDADEVFKSQLHRVRDYVIDTPHSIRLKEEIALVSNTVMCEFI